MVLSFAMVAAAALAGWSWHTAARADGPFRPRQARLLVVWAAFAGFGRLVDIVRPSGLTALIEPGRVLLGPAGSLVTRIVDIKHFEGGRQFVVLDAGMTEVTRPSVISIRPSASSGSVPVPRSVP